MEFVKGRTTSASANRKCAPKVPDLTSCLVRATGGCLPGAPRGDTCIFHPGPWQTRERGRQRGRERERERASRHKRGQTCRERSLCFLLISLSAERKMERCQFSSTPVRQMLSDFDFFSAATLVYFHFFLAAHMYSWFFLPM